MMTNIISQLLPPLRLLVLIATLGVVCANTTKTANATPSTFPTASLPVGSTNIASVDPTLSEGLGRFFEAIAKDRNLRSGNSEKSQLYLWKGNNYKSGRTQFWNAALQRSLKATGYSVQEVNDQEVGVNIYEAQYGLSAIEGDEDLRKFIKLQMGDTQEYFVATHLQSGRTYIGLWLDQTQAKQCLLAVAQVGTKVVKNGGALPAIGGANVLLVKDPHNVMKGVTPPKNPVFAKIPVRAGYVRGLVKTMSGQPIQGATIVVNSSAIGGLRTSITAKSNAQGLYEVVLPVGACQVVNCDYQIRYNGKTLLLPLHTLDGQREIFNSRSGHVENFVLRIWGIANSTEAEKSFEYGAAYYGGQIRIQWFTDVIPETGILQVTLAPQGPLLDRTQGKTFVVRVLAKKGGASMNDCFVNNLPIGRYSLKAEVLDAGDRLPLKLKQVYSSEEPTEKMLIDFKPFSTVYASHERSGIERFDVVAQP